jgi:hypothetical protein
LAQWALATLVALGADSFRARSKSGIDPLRLASRWPVARHRVAIGLLPAWQAAGVNVQEALKEAGRGSVESGGRLRSALLVAEVSLSLVLLIAVGLLLTSFARLQQVKPGFQLGRCVQRTNRAAADTLRPREARRLLRAVVSTPVDAARQHVGRADRPRAADRRAGAGAGGDRRPPLPPLSERPQANRHLVSPRYFATLGIPILAGRDFDERDNSRVPHVVIVNETFARRHFPGENPIGRTLVTGMAQLPSQIVGVVADVRSTS